MRELNFVENDLCVLFCQFPTGCYIANKSSGIYRGKVTCSRYLKARVDKLFVKNQTVNILGVVGHTVSVTSTYSAFWNEALKQVRMAQI